MTAIVISAIALWAAIVGFAIALARSAARGDALRARSRARSTEGEDNHA